MPACLPQATDVTTIETNLNQRTSFFRRGRTCAGLLANEEQAERLTAICLIEQTATVSLLERPHLWRPSLPIPTQDGMGNNG